MRHVVGVVVVGVDARCVARWRNEDSSAAEGALDADPRKVEPGVTVLGVEPSALVKNGSERRRARGGFGSVENRETVLHLLAVRDHVSLNGLRICGLKV